MKAIRLIIGIVAIGLLSSLNAQEMKRKEPNITASYQIEINAPIEKVWEALAVDYAGIGKWASGVNHVIESSGEGSTAKRFCEISAAGFNDTRERVIKYEPENHYFEYELYEGLPGFVKYSINKDRLERKGDKTLWTSSNDMYVGGFMGLTMKGVMRKSLVNVLKNKAEELKHFVETERPHPRKQEAMAKLEKKALFVITQDIQASPEKVWKVIASDFDKVSNSHPVSPHSEFTNGSNKVEIGSQRVMYMSENRKKYFVDEIVKLDNDMKTLLINVVEAKGYPIAFSNVEFIVDPISSNTSKLTMVFSFQTKPRFLQKMAKGSLKKQLQEYLFAIDHHVMSGEVITVDRWKKIRKKYH